MKLFEITDKKIYFAPFNSITLTLSKAFPKFQGFIDQEKQGENIVVPSLVPAGALVLIYSPNYWNNIGNALPFATSYIITEVRGEILMTPFKKFQDYTEETFCKQAIYNNTRIQKSHWVDNYQTHIKQNDSLEYGFAWGNPENENDPLGNYLAIKNKIQSFITPQSTVLEIGTLNGKWTQYLLNADNIICVDINTEFQTWILEKYSDYHNKISFYVTQGDELNGIISHSVDLVFSIDTFVRVDRNSIENYIKEIKRVLVPKGRALLHLPNFDLPLCQKKSFTPLTTQDIESICNTHFLNVNINSSTILHGSIVTLSNETQQ